MFDKEKIFVFSSDMKKLSINIDNCCPVTSVKGGFAVFNVAYIDLEYDRDTFKIYLKNINGDILACDFIFNVNKEDKLEIEKETSNINFKIVNGGI